jgi:hypothetical protein
MRLQFKHVRVHFYKNLNFCSIPYINGSKLKWHEKNGTPYCTVHPYFEFNWLNFGMVVVIGSPEYWEKQIWIKFYNKNNKELAAKTWPWYRLAKNSWYDELN